MLSQSYFSIQDIIKNRISEMKTTFETQEIHKYLLKYCQTISIMSAEKTQTRSKNDLIFYHFNNVSRTILKTFLHIFMFLQKKEKKTNTFGTKTFTFSQLKFAENLEFCNMCLECSKFLKSQSFNLKKLRFSNQKAFLHALSA